VAPSIHTAHVRDLTIAASSLEFTLDDTLAAGAAGNPFATNLHTAATATTDDAATLDAAVQYQLGSRRRLGAGCHGEIDVDQSVRSAHAGLGISCQAARVIPSRRIARYACRRNTTKPLRLSG